MSNRIFDASSVDKLSTLVAIAKDNGLAVTLDFIGSGKEDLWIVQIFDLKERLIVSANAKTANDAVRRLHDNWFSKAAPKA